ncbi:protein of unknown function [Moritella yayanosii]|uniref:Uncharacterized protein n=1 Tax=Moritella yayanosii TaxID=69539 RepID=A0A330LSW0_9GAMM|nr:protein of unknown function [Moritella yayanosii]
MSDGANEPFINKQWFDSVEVNEINLALGLIDNTPDHSRHYSTEAFIH